MKVYEPAATTNPETIERYGQLAVRGDTAEVAAQGWTEAGFEDAMTARWLRARCFDAWAARALSDLGVTPEQAAVRTRDGGEGHIDTIGWKVANRDLTPRQGAARSLSSR
jgi:hypothetical protein